ncbi:MAG: transporter [Bacteroidota bacterium]
MLCISFIANAQDTEIPGISADRPGVATPPFISETHCLQIETGAAYERIKEGSSLQENILYNTTLLRFGLNKNTEIRLQTDYARLKTDSFDLIGFNPLIVGTKIKMAEAKGIIPAISFLMNLTLPYFGAKSFRPEHLSPSFYLLMQNDISQDINICYNLGIEYDGSNPEPTDFAALCLGYNLNEKLSLFIENYNYFASNSPPQNFIDIGGAYLLRKNLQIDLSGNLRLQQIENYVMLNVGVSWRIPK